MGHEIGVREPLSVGSDARTFRPHSTLIAIDKVVTLRRRATNPNPKSWSASEQKPRDLGGTIVALVIWCAALPTWWTAGVEKTKEDTMDRRIIGASICIGTLLAAGCDSATKAEKEAREVQQKADEEAAKAHALAEQTAAKAQANANDVAREADRVLFQKKADFKSTKQKELDELSKRVDELRAKATTAKNDVKASVDSALAEATQRRANAEAELRSLESVAATELDQAEERVNQQLALFKKSVDEAEKKI
jgi:hypothetical protein